MRDENMGNKDMGTAEKLRAKVRWGEEREAVTDRELLFLFFCYLEWLRPEVQSEVQQEREKETVDLWGGTDALTSWQSLDQQ